MCVCVRVRACAYVYVYLASDHTTKHTGPVWQVSFVSHYNKDSNEAEEVLVSVSSDGQVSRWAMMKSFERSGKRTLDPV